MIRPLIVAAFCTALLAACQAREPDEAAWSRYDYWESYEDELVEQSVVLPEPRQTVSRNVPLPRPRPEGLTLAAQDPDGDVPPNGSATVPITGLVGLDFEGTKALLGQPELDEVQAPARVWVYSGDGCVLRVFFYPHVGATSYRALAYEVKGSEDTAEFRDRCFTGLVRDRAKRTG